jgi:hypothetical protein
MSVGVVHGGRIAHGTVERPLHSSAWVSRVTIHSTMESALEDVTEQFGSITVTVSC